MTDNSGALRRARQRESKVKRRCVEEVLAQLTGSGERVSFPAVAGRAGVSVSFLYAHADLARRIADARDRQAQAGRERAWRLPARSLVTEQSMRADLANSKAQLRRQNEEIAALQARLALDLGARGEAYYARTPERADLEQKVAQAETENGELRERVFELEGRLQEADEALEAARSLNRELMAVLNRSRGTERQSTSPSPRPRR
jgi:chromosome segregation ATPase